MRKKTKQGLTYIEDTNKNTRCSRYKVKRLAANTRVWRVEHTTERRRSYCISVLFNFFTKNKSILSSPHIHFTHVSLQLDNMFCLILIFWYRDRFVFTIVYKVWDNESLAKLWKLCIIRHVMLGTKRQKWSYKSRFFKGSLLQRTLR